MEAKKISVIIPCYNVEEYLERCWMSLQKQTIGLNEIECIFVNDGSTDDGRTYEKLLEIEVQAPETVMVVNLETNSGQGGARNIALTYASGEYIQFLDADDELRDDALEILYDVGTKQQSDIIQYNHLYILGDLRKSSGNSKENRLFVLNSKPARIPFLNSSIVTYGCTNKFIRRELILEAAAKFPTGMKYEEPLFIYPLFLYAKRIYLLNEELYLYYFRPNSTVTSQLGKRLLDHPKVQLMLMEYCLERESIYLEYKDVIDMYFLWSFYLETITFAASENTRIPLEYFEFMQSICRKFCVGFRDNPMIELIPKKGLQALDSIFRVFKDQRELDEFILEYGDCI